VHKTVAKSTAEAEHTAIGIATQSTLIAHNIISERSRININDKIKIYNNNQAAIYTCNKKALGTQMRHIVVNYLFVEDSLDCDMISVEYTSTDDMSADIFTKALPM
jgi:hypothetical protein